MDSIQWSLTVVIALIMMGVGTAVDFSQMRDIFRERSALLLGLGLQLFLLPLTAFVVLHFSGLTDVWKMGLFLVALCPGGTMSNFMAYLLKVDVALSMAMTSINSIVALISIPLLTQWALDYYIGDTNRVDFHFGVFVEQIVLIVLFPLALGMVVRYYMKPWVRHIQQPLKVINTSLLALVFTFKFFFGGENGLQYNDIMELFPYAFLIHFFGLVLSFLIPYYLFKVKKPTSVTIAIEVGLQNTALALLITDTMIGNTQMGKPALVVAMFSFFTTLLFGLLTVKRHVLWLRY